MLSRSAQHSLDKVAKAFADKIAELQELTLLRADNASKDINSQDLVALDSSVQAVELKLREIQRFVNQEKQAVDKAKVLISACSKQRDQLQYLSTHLPTRLPEAVAVQSRPQQQAAGVPAPAKETSGDEVSDSDENRDTANQEPQPTRQAANDKKKRLKAPRRYISHAELASVSSYMRGRLTIETVNAALGDAASHSEANNRLMAAARSNSVKPADRKRATTLLHCVAGKEGIRGRFWFVDSDLKKGTALKLDKTGKAILTVLRHLGRLTEVRVSLDGMPQAAYVLQPE